MINTIFKGRANKEFWECQSRELCEFQEGGQHKSRRTWLEQAAEVERDATLHLFGGSGPSQGAREEWNEKGEWWVLVWRLGVSPPWRSWRPLQRHWLHSVPMQLTALTSQEFPRVGVKSGLVAEKRHRWHRGSNLRECVLVTYATIFHYSLEVDFEFPNIKTEMGFK